MPVLTHLVVSDPARRRHLQSVFEQDAGFVIVSDDLDVANCGHPVHLYLVDLTCALAWQPTFWMKTHVLNPWARRMGISGMPVDQVALRSAVHAGAYYLVTWNDPPERWLEVARAAGCGRGYVPVGAALEAMIHLFHSDSEKLVSLGNPDVLRIEPRVQRVFLRHSEILLTRLELRVLFYLARRAGRVVSHAELLQAVWGESSRSIKATDSLKAVVKRLRQKIEPNPGRPHYILTLRGRGYLLLREMIHFSEPASLSHNTHGSLIVDYN